MKLLFLSAQFSAFRTLVLNEFDDDDSFAQLEAWHAEYAVFDAMMRARAGAEGPIQ
jgi:hypothetical protein